MPDQYGTKQSVHLLWTGGWDSTFRLLTLLLVQGRCVQPYYILDDAQRRAVPAERAAMQRIRNLIEQRRPEAAARLLSTTEQRRDAVAPDPTIAVHYENCLRHTVIGGQYEWLARFCKQRGLDGLELSIHRDDKARRLLASLMGADRYTLDPRHEGDSRYELFKYFRYPLFDETKIDMRERTRELGFDEFMQLTWFCHTPRRGRPCGACNPCIFTIEEGLGERVPAVGRLRYRVRVIPRLRAWLAQSPRLYLGVRALYRRLRGGSSGGLKRIADSGG
ncbi:MAG TPA: hypothetical protein VK025_03000 [Steroidobacter sp.]|jgi:hypothetical protein|nr:hypothetical protein [Steroidobacteraceae bacterium]HLS80352.1 hypothetical protein [Steroidobacter sp.]